MSFIIIKSKDSQSKSGYYNFKLMLDVIPTIFKADYIEFISERSNNFTRSNLSALNSQANKCWKSLEKYNFLGSKEQFLEQDKLYAFNGKAFHISNLSFINNFSEFLCKKYYLSLGIPLVKNKFFTNKRFGYKDTYLAFVPIFIRDDFIDYLQSGYKKDYAIHAWKLIFVLLNKLKYNSIELICDNKNIDTLKKALLKESTIVSNYYNTFIKHLRIKYQIMLNEPVIEFKNRIHYIDYRYPKELRTNYESFIKIIHNNNSNNLITELISSRDTFWRLALKKNIKTIEGVYSLYCSSEWMQAKSDLKNLQGYETLISKYLRYKGYENPELSRRIYRASQNKVFVIKKDGGMNYIDTTTIPYYILPLYKKYLTHLKLKSLSGTISRLKHFFYFMKNNKIESLSDLSREDLAQLKIYFLSKKFSNGTIRQTFGDIQSFYFYVYQTDRQFAAYPETFNRIQFGRGQDPHTSSIPTSIMKQIVKAIKKEIDPIAKALFAVEYHLGLRLGDILSLKVSCLKPNEIEKSYWDFYYYDNKREKYEARHKIPRTLYEPLNNLIDFTINLREKSGLEYIFIHNRNDSIQTYSPTGTRYKRQKFIDFHKIVNENGDRFSFDNKLMRRTVIKRMKDSGADFISVSEQFHNTWYTTAKYYDKTNSEEYIDTMVEAVEQITIASSFNDLPSYMTKKDENFWRIEEGYCKSETAVADKSKMCPHLIKRESCFGCPSMVTTPDFIPALERLHEEWQEEINRLVEFGEDGIKHFEWRLSTVSALIERLKVYKKELP